MVARSSLEAQVRQLQQALLALTTQEAEAIAFRPAAWQMLACIPGQEKELEALCEQLDPSLDDTDPGGDAIVFRITRDNPMVVDFDAGIVTTEDGRHLGTVDELVAEWPDLRYGELWRHA
jgi:hypothetical protein